MDDDDDYSQHPDFINCVRERETEEAPSFDMKGWVNDNRDRLTVHEEPEPPLDPPFDCNTPNYATRDTQSGTKHVSGQMMDDPDLKLYSVENSLHLKKSNQTWYLDGVKVLCKSRFYKGREVWEPFSYSNVCLEGDAPNTLRVKYPAANNDIERINPPIDTYQHHMGAVERTRYVGDEFEFKIYVPDACGGTKFVRSSRAKVVASSLPEEGELPSYQIKLLPRHC